MKHKLKKRIWKCCICGRTSKKKKTMILERGYYPYCKDIDICSKEKT